MRPTDRQISNDRVVKCLGYTIWLAPFAIASILIWQFMLRNHVRTSFANDVAKVSVQVSDKPIMTQAILRPRSSVSQQAALQEPGSQQQLMAMAFMPTSDAANSAAFSINSTKKELTTASTRSSVVKPKRGASAYQNKPWRMQTMRDVGIADGLRLIASGSMLTLAGVEPLDRTSKCKRLDGIEEPCSIRASSRLEVLTRGRTITCRIYEADAGEPTIASCRADKIDLADDLIKNGLARRGDA
jgi:endonuclease YncB( thermonuclease family)